jgi:hypothetical protein
MPVTIPIQSIPTNHSGSTDSQEREETMTITDSNFIESEFEAQREHATRIANSKFDYTVVVAGAFVRGMRDVGYRSNAYAINELIDNAYQAGASKVAVWSETGRQNNVVSLAVIDNGHGMIPDMIRLAMLWGGTHRENSRALFGRFGFGLPSASVSIGKRFTVYSKVEGGEWYSCSFDLDAVENNTYTDEDGRIVMPEPQVAKIPSWVLQGISQRHNFGVEGLSHGTIVVIDKIDKLRPSTLTASTTHFKTNFGQTYRNFCARRPITVQGDVVTSVDPMFLMPGAWAYDYDDQRAVELEPIEILMENKETGEQGIIKVRFSQMPYYFLRLDPNRPKERGVRNNPRFKIRDQNNGIVVLRAGRQLDVVSTSRGQEAELKRPFFVNNDDRTWCVELDFSPILDDEFAVTTSKQTIKMSARVWKALEAAGVFVNIREMRKKYDTEKADAKAQKETDAGETRPSEESMGAADSKNRRDKSDPTQEERQKAGFQAEQERRAKAAGVPPETIAPALEQETQARKWVVDFEDLPAVTTYFRLHPIGGQKRLWINTGHRFYAQVYAGPDSNEGTRAQWEVMLFILGDCENSATEEMASFYESERVEWSRRLMVTLAELVKVMPPAEPRDDEVQVDAVA